MLNSHIQLGSMRILMAFLMVLEMIRHHFPHLSHLHNDLGERSGQLGELHDFRRRQFILILELSHH